MLELIEVNGTPGSQLSTPRSGKSPSPSPTSPGSLRKQRYSAFMKEAGRYVSLGDL
ncbi:Dclk1 [Phodopus roborovskii]|uniref:Dclk1 protein n=1 Tax=Phodopus roborovskii TaxID=109678 RepID=A0AAU9YZ67_PHORO|nr:Dclk1 [Phodopus roborovskii]